VGMGPACCRRMAPRCRAPPDLSCPLPEGRSRRRAAPVRCPRCRPAAVPPPPAATAAPALHPCGPATGPGGDTMLAPRPHMPVSPGAGTGRDRALGHPASTRPRLLPAARQSGTTGEGPSSSGKGSVRDARAARCSLGQKTLCSGTRGTKPHAGLVQASPSVSAASSSRDWSTPGTGAPWGHMHPEDQSTPGTGEPWGPVQPGDLSTLGTRAPWGPEHPRDWTTLVTRTPWGPEHPMDQKTSRITAPWGTEHPGDLSTPGTGEPLGSSHSCSWQLPGWWGTPCQGMHQGCGLHTHLQPRCHGQAFGTAPLLPLTTAKGPRKPPGRCLTPQTAVTRPRGSTAGTYQCLV